MNSIRKWIFRPKRSDTAHLAQFYYADEELNLVAAELDSFDGRKDPERCTSLVTQLRRCQDAVLGIVEKIMAEMIPHHRASRDYRVKFPEDVLQESLAGQLWFGAECLAAGSSILNHEVESASMRPLAKNLTHHLDHLRSLLREQALKNQNIYNDKIVEALIEFDKLFAEFELSYVSAMVPVKTMREHDLLQEVMVLFCETVQRALKLRLLFQDQLDAYDPALMFTIPRLAIVCGLLVYPEGPLNPDMDPLSMSEMFRPFQTLLFKIRELLWTLSREELWLLEKSLCSTDEASIAELSTLQAEINYQRTRPIGCDSPSSPVDSEADEGDKYPSVMVHSDSTMTVVAQSECGLTAASASGIASAEGDEYINKNNVAQFQTISALEDGENKQPKHSSSRQKLDCGTRQLDNQTHPAGNSSLATTMSNSDLFEENSTSRCPMQFASSSREFNINLPHDTGSQEAINTPVSLEVSLTHVPDICLLRSRKSGFIYITNSEDEEETRDAEQQISFITDAFCQLFNPSNTVVRLKNNISWPEQSSASRDRGGVSSRERSVPGDDAKSDGENRANKDHVKLESSVEEENGSSRRPTCYRRWFSSPAGDVSCPTSTGQDISCNIVAQRTAVGLLPDPVLPELPRIYSDTDCALLPTDNDCREAISLMSNTAIVTDDAFTDVCNDRDVGHHISVSECFTVDGIDPVLAKDDAVQTGMPNCETGLQTQVKDVFTEVPGNDRLFGSSEDMAETQPVYPIESASEVTENSTVLSPDFVVKQHVVENCRNAGEYSQTPKLSMEYCASSEVNHCDRKIVGTSSFKQKIYSRNREEDNGRESACVPSSRKAGNRSASFVPKTETEFRGSSAMEHSVVSIKSLEYDWDRKSYCSSETSSYTSENHDDEEIAMAIQAAEVAARNEARSRFKSSTDLIHRLFVCISGVADQLQTNYASDLRHILKAVFECYTSDIVDRTMGIGSALDYVHDEADDEADDYNGISNSQSTGVEVRPRIVGVNSQNSGNSSDPPQWVPDEQSSYCMSCRVSFTFVRRRHHCRNCGKLFCSHCSSNCVPLPHFGHTKPVRVCNHCYMFRVTPFTAAH